MNLIFLNFSAQGFLFDLNNENGKLFHTRNTSEYPILLITKKIAFSANADLLLL